MPKQQYSSNEAKAIRERMLELIDYTDRSYREVSIKIGRSSNYISEIVTRESLPSMDAFLDFCSYFGITPKEFFDDAEMPIYNKKVIGELKRLMGDEYEMLGDYLKTLKPDDLKELRNLVFDLYKKLRDMGAHKLK